MKCITFVLCGLIFALVQPLQASAPQGRAPATLSDRIEKFIETWGDRNTSPPLDAVLVGYALGDPRQGWSEVRKLIEEPSTSFIVRYSGLRAMERLRLVAPEVLTEEAQLSVLAKLLEQPDMTDLVVDRLRKAQSWKLTGNILQLQKSASHQLPVIQRSIIRYALGCPDAAAKRFLDELRRKDKERVEEVERLLNQ